MTGIGQQGKLVIGDLTALEVSHQHEIPNTHLSKESDVKVSCHTTLHHNLLRTISFDWVFGGVQSRLSLRGVLCRPSDWARRQVNPISAHDASAFMSFRRTKHVRRRAWMESKEGLRCVSPSCQNWQAALPKKKVAQSEEVK